MRDERIDEAAFTRILERLDASEVDAVTVLGSTGNFAYLTREERRRIVQIAAGSTSKPLTAGISAPSTRAAITHALDAQDAGATALLLAPVSYQPLTASEVLQHVVDVAAATDLPIVAYDNPTTTNFRFDDQLYRSIAEIPNVTAWKTPASTDPATRIRELREALPESFIIGTSGDATGAAHLAAGFDVWYSVLAGLFPEITVDLSRNPQAASAFAPLWHANDRHGSLRVLATLADMLDYAASSCLPKPLQLLDATEREALLPVCSLLAAPTAYSGDGWVSSPEGRRYWGRYGAAGLVVFDPKRDSVLLQHRAPWSHQGDTWGIPGGARDGNETPYEAALREAHEEASVPAAPLTRIHEHTFDLGFWSYTTYVVTTSESFEPAANDTESAELRWVSVDAVTELPLHPGFATSWPGLREAIEPYRLRHTR